MLFCKLYFSYLVFVTVAAETTSQDKEKDSNNDKLKPNIQRRFIEDLDDKEWHVSHLRDMEFDTEGDCDDTFESKANRYRETLKRDAALVEYVSSDALTGNKPDVSKGKCKRNITDIFNNKGKLNSELNVTHRKENNATPETNEAKSQSENNKNSTSDGEVRTATVSVKEVDSKVEKRANLTNKEAKRRSEYQFSSVEYYDEVPDFDHSICPDTVDVIDLELDQLRNYDVECEAILEWRSLE